MNEVIKAFLENKKFIITSHMSPDGDNIGASVASYHLLSLIGKKVVYMLDDDVPQNLLFLTKDIEKIESKDFNENSNDYVLLVLDCGSRDRICCSEKIINGVNSIINIDHHVSNNSYANYNCINIEATSTCEVLYKIFLELQKILGLDLIKKDIAEALYTGLITDTGNFMYSSVNSETFDIAKQLLKTGFDRQKVVIEVFQNNTLCWTQILAKTLSRIKIINKKIAISYLLKEDFKEFGCNPSDTEGIIEYLRNIMGVEIAIFLKENFKGEVKLSLRSKSFIDCNKIAKEFSGGGHLRAAGATMNLSMKDAIEKVTRLAKIFISEN